MYSKIIGYAPDVEPTTPGVIKGAENIVPTVRGVSTAPSANNTSLDPLTGTCVGALSIMQTDGTVRTFAGTTGELFEAAGTGWTDVSRGGADYTAGASWHFSQYGDMSLATNGVAVLQFSSSGAFADLTGAPKAQVIEVVNNQVLALNTSDATFGSSPNRWWFSALGNPGSWAPSIATQAVSNTLSDTPGKITAGKKVGSNVLIFKEQATYLGAYVGPPEIWQFLLLSRTSGCVGKKAVAAVNDFAFFMGIDDFYIFDGASVRPIGGDLRNFFFSEELNKDNWDQVVAVSDVENSRIYWYYPSLVSGSNKLDRFVVFDYLRNRWGIGPRGINETAVTVETVFPYIRTTGPTYNTLGNFYSTYADLPAIAFDSSFWQARVNRVGLFNTSHKLQTLDGAATSSTLILWDMGQEARYSFVKRLRPRFLTTPSSATLAHSYRDDLGVTETSDTPTVSMSEGKFDLEREARWHSSRVTFSGEMELVGVDVDITGAGVE